MREVIYTDGKGRRHRSLVRDDDPDAAAPRGIRRDPPDVRTIDWEKVKLELHNGLVDLGLFTWADVQQKQDFVTGLLLGVLRRRLVELYRAMEVMETEGTTE